MSTTRFSRRCITSALITACLLFAVTAAADRSGGNEGTASVEDRAKAAEAYDEGTAAYLAGRYDLAAHWFERAYRLVPTSAALLQAARARVKANDVIGAANLALELTDEYPADTKARSAADAIIAPAKQTSLLVRAKCETHCNLELDGAVVQHPSFFVTPDVDHTLKAGFEHGETSTVIRGEAGKTEKVLLSGPPPPAPPRTSRVPRWAFFSSLGATVAVGAVTVWSGIDTNRGVADYEAAARNASSPGINNGASPTPAEQAQALLDEGRAKERRTNILIGVTAGMAATTAVLGVFTNWKGESREVAKRRLEPSVTVTRRGGALMLEGRF